jgi:hypothetical protein
MVKRAALDGRVLKLKNLQRQGTGRSPHPGHRQQFAGSAHGTITPTRFGNGFLEASAGSTKARTRASGTYAGDLLRRLKGQKNCWPFDLNRRVLVNLEPLGFRTGPLKPLAILPKMSLASRFPGILSYTPESHKMLQQSATMNRTLAAGSSVVRIHKNLSPSKKPATFNKNAADHLNPVAVGEFRVPGGQSRSDCLTQCHR